MYRRRRPPKREVAFSFDSFLDLVANVIGIIIRLILVAWVGARTYQSSMEANISATPVEAYTEPKLPADPLQREMLRTQQELELARANLYDKLKELETVKDEKEQTGKKLSELGADEESLARQGKTLDLVLAGAGKGLPGAELTMAEIRQRSQDVVKQIQDLKKLPTLKKILRYHTPVSKPVHSDELMFECHRGRVAFIDLPALMQDVHRTLQDKIDQYRNRGDVEGVVGPVGAYRLHYFLQRQESLSGFSYELAGWVAEPVQAVRGETIEQALAKGSEFRLITDGGMSGQTVVTFWVYPDSFGLFRQLRDFLYERGLEVAGRPINEGMPMAASRNGTKSRGQ